MRKWRWPGLKSTHLPVLTASESLQARFRDFPPDQFTPAMAERARALAFLPLITISAWIIYSWHLGQKSLWFDELATWEFARISPIELWRALHQCDAFYGLYYAFIHVWMAGFGASESALRAPSVLFAGAALPLVYLVARNFFSELTAYVSAVLLGLNPFYVNLAHEARAYSLFFFVTVLFTIAFLHAERRNSRLAWFQYGVLALLGIYIHLFAIFMIAAQGVYLLAINRRQAWLPFLVVAGTCAVGTLPLANLVVHDANSQNTWLRTPHWGEIRDLFYMYAGSKPLARCEEALAVLGVGLALWTRKNGGLAVAAPLAYLLSALFVPIIGVFAISHFRPIYFPRYMIAELLPFVLLYAWACTRWRRYHMAAVLTGVLIVLDATQIQRDANSEMQNWREVAKNLTGQVHGGDGIVASSVAGLAALRYYAPEMLATRGRLVYPRPDLHVWDSDLSSQPGAQIFSQALKFRRIWFIEGDPHSAEPQTQTLRPEDTGFTVSTSIPFTRIRVDELVRNRSFTGGRSHD